MSMYIVIIYVYSILFFCIYIEVSHWIWIKFTTSRRNLGSCFGLGPKKKQKTQFCEWLVKKMPRIIDVKLLWQKVFSKFNMTNFIQCIYIYTVIYDNNDNDNSISCPLRWRSYSSRSQDGTSRERPKGWLLLRILHGQHRPFICCFCFRDIPRYDIYIIYIYAVYLLVCVSICVCAKKCMSV